jgi:hypothetical protein
MLTDEMDRGNRLQHCYRRGGRVYRMFYFGNQHDEFIVAMPAYRV